MSKKSSASAVDNKSLSKKGIILVSAAIVALIGVIIALVFVFVPRTSETDKLEASKPFSMVKDVASINGVAPASIVIAPATQKWWDNLLNFSSNTVIRSLDFNSISENAIYVAYTTSKGAQYQNYQSIGLPTTFVIYKDKESARTAGAQVSNEYEHFVRANMLLLVPTGAYTDVDYALNQYQNASIKIGDDDLNLNGRALWQINLKEFGETFTKEKDENDIDVYENFVNKFGVTDTSGWVGYSSDGLSWDGQLENIDVSKVQSPSQIMDYLNEQKAYLKTDGTLYYGSEGPPEVDQSGIVYPRQSRIIDCCMILSNNEETDGSLLVNNGTEIIKGKVLPKKSGYFQMEFLSNQWFALMMGQTTAFPVSSFDKVTVTVKDLNGNTSIVLTPLVIEE